MLIIGPSSSAAPTPITFTKAADLGGADNMSSLTVAYTLGTGSNLLILILDSGTADDVTSVTYAGAAMTAAWRFPGVAGWSDSFSMWFLLGPAASGNVVVTASTVHRLRAVAGDYAGAAQSGQPDALSPGRFTGAGGANQISSYTDTVTTVSAGAWAIAGFIGYVAGPVMPIPGPGSTFRVAGATFGMPALFDSGGPIATPGAYSMTVNTATQSSGGLRIASFSHG